MCEMAFVVVSEEVGMTDSVAFPRCQYICAKLCTINLWKMSRITMFIVRMDLSGVQYNKCQVTLSTSAALFL